MFKTLREIWNSIEGKEKQYLLAGLQLILVFGIISILILPFLFTLPSSFSWIDFSNKGPVGDTINGIAGPFIAIIAAILTFLAFYIQYKANIQQRDQFIKSLEKQKEESKEQEKIWRIERFENKFYELLKLHKANVNEMNIADKVVGRKCFVNMFYELKCCYQIVEDFYNSTTKEEQKENKYNKINLMDFSYRIFFFGIGLHSEKHFITSLNKGELHLFGKVKPFLEKIQEDVLRYLEDNPQARYYTYGLPNNNIPTDKTVEFYYFPFDGHVNKLGHYYRHLFQTVTYIATQDFLTDDEKYSYVKTLRAQISNFEQLLLYYNALAWFDNEWKVFFTKFRFIKNLPLSLADFHETPEKHFDKEIKELNEQGIAMFEWLE